MTTNNDWIDSLPCICIGEYGQPSADCPHHGQNHVVGGATDDEPTAIRNPRKSGGKAHRKQTMDEAVAMGALPHAVTGCSRWTRDMTERVPLSRTNPADRCRICYPTPKGTS